MDKQAKPSKRYVRAAQVRRRYGDITDMTLWRWTHDPEINFPQPEYLNGRDRFWDEAKLDAYDRAQARQARRRAASRRRAGQPVVAGAV
jgi:predicted DNA-binding transcriptional regulator AlpA